MILLDANILLELIISGRKSASRVMHWMEHDRLPYAISMLTVHLVLHFGIKDGLGVRRLKQFIADYPIEPLLTEDYISAMDILVGQDHEDALQLAVARRTGCTAIVTLDKQFANTYKNQMDFIVP